MLRRSCERATRCRGPCTSAHCAAHPPGRPHDRPAPSCTERGSFVRTRGGCRRAAPISLPSVGSRTPSPMAIPSGVKQESNLRPRVQCPLLYPTELFTLGGGASTRFAVRTSNDAREGSPVRQAGVQNRLLSEADLRVPREAASAAADASSPRLRAVQARHRSGSNSWNQTRHARCPEPAPAPLDHVRCKALAFARTYGFGVRAHASRRRRSGAPHKGGATSACVRVRSRGRQVSDHPRPERALLVSRSSPDTSSRRTSQSLHLRLLRLE